MESSKKHFRQNLIFWKMKDIFCRKSFKIKGVHLVDMTDRQTMKHIFKYKGWIHFTLVRFAGYFDPGDISFKKQY